MNASLVMQLLRISRHVSDQDIANELADNETVFGPTFQHCYRCKPCHDRWLIALGLERLIR